MAHFYVLLCFCISIEFLSAQIQVNLVQNGDFENFSQLPDDLGQWARCRNWVNVNGIGTSPDYYHRYGSGFAQLPNNLMASIEPHSGDALMGFISWGNVTLPNYHEYISTLLKQPMTQGKFYQVSFWMSSGSGNWKYGFSVQPLGLLLSVGAQYQPGKGLPIKADPQFEVLGEFWSSSWVKYTYVVYADSAYEHLTMGLFNLDNEDINASNIVAGYQGSYVFVDDVEIIEINEKELKMPNAFTPNQDGYNDYFRPIGLREDELLSFRIYNRWGQEVYNGDKTGLVGWDGIFEGMPQPRDTYIYLVTYKQAINLEPVTVKGFMTLLR